MVRNARSYNLQTYGTMKVAATSMLLLAAGCTTPRARNWSPDEHSFPSEEMSIAPGDALGVQFFGAPELSSTNLVVRRDGRISMHLVGDVKVAGYTPHQVQSALKTLYEDQLQIKEISVSVAALAPVYISGAVLNPGRLNTARPITALEAIMETGGFNEVQAEIRNVLVIRHSDGERATFALNYETILDGETDNPFYLQPFDIVYVPRTKIVKVDQWVDQHISRIIPATPVTVSSEGEVFFSP